ncbi:MAG: hypothetical protein R3E79_31800 [Caldilineaceae bacterium]
MNSIVELDVTTDLLTRLESQQTPLRIQGHRQSYYVLTVDQLLALMQPPPQNFEDDTSFTPEDFGLTEDEVTAYLARRHERQQKLGVAQPAQLPADLQQRLDRFRALVALSSDAPPVDAATMHALETAMLRSLETTIQTMKQ